MALLSYIKMGTLLIKDETKQYKFKIDNYSAISFRTIQLDELIFNYK